MSSEDSEDEIPLRRSDRPKAKPKPPPRPLKTKKTASKGKGAASSSVPPVQSKSLGKNVSSHSTHWDDFKDKEVVCEKSAKLVDLSDYNVRSILEEINWGPVLHMGGPVQYDVVRKFYASCVHVTASPPSFDVEYGSKHVTFSLKDIADLIGVPIVQEDSFDFSSLGPKPSHVIADFLCGDGSPVWVGGALRASSMSWDFRLLHNIFFRNVYPRMSNKADVSETMFRVLYRVGQGHPLCLPSRIMHTIHQVILRDDGNSTSLPFGHLIYRMAGRVGIVGTDRVHKPIILNRTIIARMELTKEEI